jgi:hypothetical protein
VSKGPFFCSKSERWRCSYLDGKRGENAEFAGWNKRTVPVSGSIMSSSVQGRGSGKIILSAPVRSRCRSAMAVKYRWSPERYDVKRPASRKTDTVREGIV